MIDFKSATPFTVFRFLPAPVAVALACLGASVPASAQDSPSRIERASEAGGAGNPGSAQAASPEAAGSGCVIRKAAYKTSVELAGTSSGTWVKLPNSAVKFTQGGSGPGCVIVQFSGVAGSPTSLMPVRARIGNKLASPPAVQFHEVGQASAAQTFTFIFPKINPGARKVVIEWHRQGGSDILMYERTTLVQHR